MVDNANEVLVGVDDKNRVNFIFVHYAQYFRYLGGGKYSLWRAGLTPCGRRTVPANVPWRAGCRRLL